MIKKDLKKFMNERLESIVDEHLNCWMERYFRKTNEQVEDDIKYNYDFSGEIEEVEMELKRKLDVEEVDFYIDEFITMAGRIFYKD